MLRLPQSPAVSVIVPIFNVAAHVGAAIESLRAQRFTDFEAILVDDGSTDGSAAIAMDAAAGDLRFRLITRRNGGLSAARNSGLDAATGTFIAFLDSDDRMDPDYLGALHGVLAQTQADWAACALRFCNADGSTLDHPARHGQAGLPESTAPQRLALLDWGQVIGHFPSAWNKMYRRTLVQGLRFDEGLVFEDHSWFWQIAARTDHLIWLPRPLYLQTQGRAGQITRDDSEIVFDQFDVLERLAQISASGAKPGGPEALARIATRLVHERSQTLAQPERRARFMQAARDFFARHALTWRPDWDDDISRSLGIVMAGEVVLSVIVATDGKLAPLQATLACLAGSNLRDSEVLICPTADMEPQTRAALLVRYGLSQSPLHPRLIASGSGGNIADSQAPAPQDRDHAAARNLGLTAACGRYVTFLVAGDRPKPAVYAGWVEGMVRQDADFGLSRFEVAGQPKAGMHDTSGLALPPHFGRLEMTPQVALCLQAQPAAKIYRRDLLLRQGLRFQPGPFGHWEMVVGAALACPQTSLYFDGVDIEVAMPPHGPAPSSGQAAVQAALQAIDGIAAAPFGAQLPKGWQDRLFARAINAVLQAAPPAPDDREAFLRAAGVAARARWPDGIGETTCEAGLDPDLLPQVRALFSPPRRGSDAATQSGGQQLRPIGLKRSQQPVGAFKERFATMLKYSPGTGGTFAYSVDFSESSYANLSFYDEAQSQILFHLSLRQDTGLCVVNRRIGPQWENERATQMALDAMQATVEITFAPPARVSVMVNGEVLHHFDGAYDDLDRIACFDHFGGLMEASFAANGTPLAARRGDGELALSPGLALTGWGYDAGHGAQVFSVDVLGLDAALSATVEARPDIATDLDAPTQWLGVALDLPGRIWDGLPVGQAVRLQLRSNGIVCGAPLTVSRHQICQQIEELAHQHPENHATAPLMLALEHIRWGGLWTQLSGHAQFIMAGVAADYGLSHFLFPQAEDDPAPAHASPTSSAPPPVLPPARRNPDTVLLESLIGQFGTALRSHDPADCPVGPGAVSQSVRGAKSGAILAAILDDVLARPVPPQIRQRLYLHLTETFCLHDAFVALHARAAAEGLADFAVEPGTPLSSALPYFYLQGRSNDLLAALKTINDQGEGWVNTAAIAWVLRQIATSDSPPLVEAAREAVVQVICDWLDSQAGDYWTRTPCVALTGAMAAAICHGQRLTMTARDRIEKVALRVYGLSSAFWADTDRESDDGSAARLSPRLRAARAAFATIEGVARVAAPPLAPGDAAAVSRALRVLQTLDCAEVDRFRLELLGPAGVIATGSATGAVLPDLASLLAEGRDPGEAALRTLAHPLSPTGNEGELAALARQMIIARYSDLAHSETLELQTCMATQALDLLRALRDNRDLPDAGARLSTLLAGCEALSGPRGAWLGLGLAIRLFTALVRGGHDALAESTLLFLSTQGAQVSAVDRAGFVAAPALHSALHGLLRAEAAARVPLAGAALDLFPEIATLVARSDAAHNRALPDDPMRASEVADLSPLFNTLVVVMSCRANLETRLPALQSGWLTDLAALGVPYVVVVGDGDGQRGGNGGSEIVHLNAPDTYEGLPQKTLAMVDWVLENTSAAHILKIDDDCFLNAAGFFAAQSYARFAYYGRTLLRTAGQTDRSWHMDRSRSPRGRMELDRSPEPSTYCDGGSGYVLSRAGLQALHLAGKHAENQRLIAASFMEDKLVGDLLATAGITPQNEDFFTFTQRRTHAQAMPVSLWVNAFLPSRATPTCLVHLDSAEPQAATRAHLETDRLLPKKIWPTTQPARLIYNSNLLDLLSPVQKLADLNAEPLAVVACIRNERFILPHFLAHYRALGVRAFLIADNLSDDGSREYLAAEPDVALFSVDTDYRQSAYGVAWQQAILGNLRVGRWSLVADADEFALADAALATPLADLLAEAEAEGADAFRLYMLDMYPKGPLSQARFASGTPFDEAGYADASPFVASWPGRGSFSNSPTWSSALRYRLLPGSRAGIFVAQKVALLRYQPWMRISAGLHYVAQTRLARRELLFAHFKYHADFRRKATAEVARRQHFNDAEEYRKYLALVSEGRDQLYDPEISVHWTDAPVVQKLLD